MAVEAGSAGRQPFTSSAGMRMHGQFLQDLRMATADT